LNGIKFIPLPETTRKRKCEDSCKISRIEFIINKIEVLLPSAEYLCLKNYFCYIRSISKFLYGNLQQWAIITSAIYMSPGLAQSVPEPWFEPWRH